MPVQPCMLDPTRLHLRSLSADSASITKQMQACSDSVSCPIAESNRPQDHSKNIVLRSIPLIYRAALPLRLDSQTDSHEDKITVHKHTSLSHLCW
jgi:hypothetical protein